MIRSTLVILCLVALATAGCSSNTNPSMDFSPEAMAAMSPAYVRDAQKQLQPLIAAGVLNEEEIPQFPMSELFNMTSDEFPESNDSYCTVCTSVANAVIKKGCSYACAVLTNPLAITVCKWVISKSNLCGRILDWMTKGDSATAVCKKIGFCNSACTCGVCTPAIAGPDGRCLGAITNCGNPYYKLTMADMFALKSEASRDFSSLASKEQLQVEQDPLGFCLRGRCEKASSWGCCLTCF